MYTNLNGKLIQETETRISPSNRSFRYGDGFFETMKMLHGKIILQDLHLNRIYFSLSKLLFDVPAVFTGEYIIHQIAQTARKNNLHMCRVRLTIFRGDGGLNDPENMRPNFLVQVYPLDASMNTANDNGLVIDTFRESIKAADSFSTIKSNNFLPYVMASFWAKQQQLNDAILLNQHGNVADSTIANVFIVSDGLIKTPPLHDGPVNGVMRMHLLNSLRKDGISVQEVPITEAELQSASEVWMTNAIRGMRWVRQMGNSNYGCRVFNQIYQRYVRPLAAS